MLIMGLRNGRTMVHKISQAMVEQLSAMTLSFTRWERGLRLKERDGKGASSTSPGQGQARTDPCGWSDVGLREFTSHQIMSLLQHKYFTSNSLWLVTIALGPLQLSIAIVIAIGNSNGDKGSCCFLYPDHSPLVVAMTNALQIAITFCPCDGYHTKTKELLQNGSP